jgi:hypothetical protein
MKSRFGLSLAITAAVTLFTAPAWASTVVLEMPHCGCCDSYVRYLQKNGFDVSGQPVKDMNKTGREYGVPEKGDGQDFMICHLMKIDGYVIVGHVPAEVIRRLLREKPKNVHGIILPGMPDGSTGMEGMGGPKKAPFVIYAFDEHGHSWVYEKI